MRTFTTLTTVLALAAACGDNGASQDPGPDAAQLDAAPDVDAGPDVDAAPPVDAAPFVLPTPFSVPLSAGGPDQLQAARPGPNDTFYAAGYAAATPTGPRLVTVVQFSSTGPVAAQGSLWAITPSLTVMFPVPRA